MISDNGGLITYQIPLEEMKMGLAFTQLENRKAELCIEDYSVAQPTLEQVIHDPPLLSCALDLTDLFLLFSQLQVFIRTVHKHTVAKKPSVGPSQGGSGAVQEEVFQEVNKCGCTRNTTMIMTIVSAILFIALWIIGIFVGRIGGIFFVLGFLALFVSVTGCSLLCCACCRPATGADE
jgi:hypothetical protein